MRRDRGAVAVEYAGFLPLTLTLVLFLFEAGMSSLTVERVENAVRTGARVAGQQHDAQTCVTAAGDALPGWLNEKKVTAAETDDGVVCTVHAQVPLLWPGIDFDLSVDRTVTMPMG